MSDTKRVMLSATILFFLSQGTIKASEYPAPPGHYGQDKILENSTFNTGKGAPYVTIFPAEETATVKTESNTSAPTESLIKPQSEPAQTQNPVMPPFIPAQQNPVAATSGPIAVPMAEQPVYSPAPETAPSRFQETIYPHANDMSRHYELSRSLPFEQWGEQLPETKKQPQYDYPATYPMMEPAYREPMNQTFQGSPDLAKEMFNPQANRGTGYKLPKRNKQSFFNPGNFPVDRMDQFWGGRNSGFMPPVNNQLKTFDQFPVPQNLYGPSAMNQPGQTGNRQYFRQIPKEEIIYPPHYPGNRQ